MLENKPIINVLIKYFWSEWEIKVISLKKKTLASNLIPHRKLSTSHTNRPELQLSRVLTIKYSTTPRVPMGIWGLVCDPRT